MTCTRSNSGIFSSFESNYIATGHTHVRTYTSRSNASSTHCSFSLITLKSQRTNDGQTSCWLQMLNVCKQPVSAKGGLGGGEINTRTYLFQPKEVSVETPKLLPKPHPRIRHRKYNVYHSIKWYTTGQPDEHCTVALRIHLSVATAICHWCIRYYQGLID